MEAGLCDRDLTQGLVVTQGRRHCHVSGGTLKPETLGQVFTPGWMVSQMLDLCRNTGRILEPSCGSGAFSNQLHAYHEDLVAIEIDAEHAPHYARIGDFFDYPATERFATIIGNPPYLRHQDIPASTKSKLDMTLFDGRTNLFLFFIEKCVHHLEDGGELIFIVPREFPKATAARKLNHWLFEQGSITDFWETGDQAVFRDATPPCCVFRFEKGRMDRTMHDGRRFTEHDGQLFFLPANINGNTCLGDLFDIAVGGVSGMDSLFAHPEGNVEVVCSETVSTGKTRRMLHGEMARKILLPHKGVLLSRGIRKFIDANWWEWGREWKKDLRPRIYVNMKTRHTNPFFAHNCQAYDGSVLALFPVNPRINIEHAARMLNQVDWKALGFAVDGRFCFGQRSLSTCVLPRGIAEGINSFS